MKTLGNILWHIPFCGFITAFIYFIFGSLLVLGIIGAPIGLGLIQYSKFLLKPFSYEMVNRAELNKLEEPNKYWKSYSFIIKIIYIPFGILFIIVSTVQAIMLAFTLVGIPLSIIIIKSLGTFFQPVNKICVPSSVANEIRNRKDKKDIEKYIK